MKTTIENDVTISQPIDKVWDMLSDPHKVAPCLPGAEITDAVSDTEFNGLVNLKLGPLSLKVKGQVEIQEKDDGAYRIRMKGKGTDSMGGGMASMVLNGQLTKVDDNTTQMVANAEVEINGKMAQFASRMIKSVSDSMFKKFIANFEERLQAS